MSNQPNPDPSDAVYAHEVPAVGEKFEMDGLNVEVVAARSNGIDTSFPPRSMRTGIRTSLPAIRVVARRRVSASPEVFKACVPMTRRPVA